MYCPRCGAPNTETTKFCRQCGLAMTPVTGYVASGGTGALTPPPTSPAPVRAEGMTPKQKMILTIVLLAMSPAICGVLGGVTGMGFIFGPLAGLSAVLMPVGIIFTVFHYRARIREWERQQQQMQWQASMQPPYQPHPAPSLPPPQSQPVPQPVPRPAYQPPASPAPPTNPLGGSPGSITEDETRRLP